MHLLFVYYNWLVSKTRWLLQIILLHRFVNNSTPIALVSPCWNVYEFALIAYTIGVDGTQIGGVNYGTWIDRKKCQSLSLKEKTQTGRPCGPCRLEYKPCGRSGTRGKIPSLETLIALINALEVSTDMVLADVVSVGYTVKDLLLAEKLDKLDPEDRRKIYDVIDTMVKNSKQIKPWCIAPEKPPSVWWRLFLLFNF